MSYYSKYQKYKRKYLELKNNSIGGTLTEDQLKRCDNGINEDGNTKDHPAICVLSMEPINPDRLEDYVMLPKSKTCVKKDLLLTWLRISRTNPFTREKISEDWIYENFGENVGIEPLEIIAQEIKEKISNININIKKAIRSLIENLSNYQTNLEIINEIENITNYVDNNPISDTYGLNQIIINLDKIIKNIPDNQALEVYYMYEEFKGLETIIDDENNEISDKYYIPLVELKGKIEQDIIKRDQMIKFLTDIIN